MSDLPNISYCTGTGQRIDRQPLSAFANRAGTRDISSVRLPASFKGQKHKPGYQWMSSSNTLVAYESRLEMFTLLHLDLNPAITLVVSQPFTLHYLSSAKEYKHTPDFLAYYDNGDLEVIDVKPRQFAKSEHNQRDFKACEAASIEMGWTHSIRSELQAVFLSNLRWLGGYRRKPPYFDEYVPQIMKFATSGLTVEKLVQAIDAPACLIRPILFFLIWKGVLSAELYQRLNNSTVIQISTGCEFR
jgi:hypothetical protein